MPPPSARNLLLAGTIGGLLLAACTIVLMRTSIGPQPGLGSLGTSSESSVSDYLSAGQKSDSAKNFKESVAVYTSLIEKNSPSSYGNMAGYLGRAYAYSQMSEYGKAIADYKSYLQLLPQAPNPGDLVIGTDVLVSEATTLARSKHYPEALSVCKEIEKAAADRSDLMKMLNAREKIYDKMGRVEEAAEDRFLLTHSHRLEKQYPAVTSMRSPPPQNNEKRNALFNFIQWGN